MDISVLPDIVALALFIAFFRPLVRRAGEHVDLWFLGWTFVLVHYSAQILPWRHGDHSVLHSLVYMGSIDLCAVTFVLAARELTSWLTDRATALALAIPILATSTLTALHTQAAAPRILAPLFYLLPALLLLPQRWRRTDRGSLVSAIAYGLVALTLTPLWRLPPIVLQNAGLSSLFLSAALLYLLSAKRVTRGVLAAVGGLAGWALSVPVTFFWSRLDPGVHLSASVMRLPQYVMIAGIVLNLLEEHVTRTEQMAMHDALTGLPNRRLFEERLRGIMHEAMLARTTVACLVIDVDNFKTINDTLGHTAGDHLLRALAVRLSWHMGPRDILARTGGDEFTALLAGVKDEHHLRFVASAMMSAASVPFTLDDASVEARISIGIALSPDDADDMESLRRAADEAMYSAKRRGGSLLAFAGDLAPAPTAPGSL